MFSLHTRLEEFKNTTISVLFQNPVVCRVFLKEKLNFHDRLVWMAYLTVEKTSIFKFLQHSVEDTLVSSIQNHMLIMSLHIVSPVHDCGNFCSKQFQLCYQINLLLTKLA